MENFNLWGGWVDEARRKVTWFATSAGFQRVQDGTQRMISEMLTDLDCPTDQIADWTVQPLATDYVSDDLDTNDWRDRWLASFEIMARMRSAIHFKPPRSYLVESMASDSTWDGEEPAPERLLVVVDFATLTDMRRSMEAARIYAETDGPEAVLQKSSAYDRQLLAWVPVPPKGLKAAIARALSIEELAQRFRGTTHWRDRLLM